MIPFSPPRIDQKIIDEVTDTLQSGWITTGPKTKRFEKEISAFCGVPATVCVGSATAGMELILRWFGVGPGDEVILPAYTYCSTANVVVHCGATPVLVDATEEFNLDVKALAGLITSNTKVIMPVDLGGWPCDYDAIMELVQSEEIRAQFRPASNVQADLNRILVLSDAAHSLGALYKGRPTGQLADASVFSFHAVKNLTTAEGGAIALNLPAPFDHEELYKQFCVSILHGQSKDALAKSKKGGWRYDVVEAGHKCNMTDIQASMGLVELERYREDTLQRRKAIFDRYSAAFSQHDWANVPLYHSEDKQSSYHVYMLRIQGVEEAQRDAIMDAIFAREVSVNVHFQPLPLLSFYKGMGYDMTDYPQAFKNYSCEISLPVYYMLSDEEVDIVIQAVVDAVEEVTNA